MTLANENNGGLIDSKNAVTSVATWGIVIAAASQMAGFTITGADSAQVVHAVQDIIGTYKEVMLAIGIVMAAVGRYNAKQPLHFLQPYQVDPVTGAKIVALPADVVTALKPLPSEVAKP